MKQFIKVCQSLYGNTTSIYKYVNPSQIISIELVKTQSEANFEALLTTKERVIILFKQDLIDLVGNEEFERLWEERDEWIERKNKNEIY